MKARARGLLAGAPKSLEQASVDGIDASAALAAWESVEHRRRLPHPGAAGQNDVESHILDLVEAVSAFQKQASEVLERREDEWRPIAVPLTAWLQDARESVNLSEKVKTLKGAEAWLKEAFDEVRSARFEPIASVAIATWNQLRMQSNVELRRVILAGSKTQRRVELDVTVDDVEGAALGVMSQGELHSLALSLFFPRATLPESPFRFLVIDDPVQSMDPARVDGLARVLEEQATTRQIVVFTHDDRLAEWIGQLSIEATILEVTRRPGSVVEVREAIDPSGGT